jgi:peroxiredoxin
MKCTGKYLIPLVFLMSMVCISATGSPIKPGIWKGILHRTDGQPIIFNFESRQLNGNRVIYVINGKEKLLVDSITQRGDSITVTMPFFNSQFTVKANKTGNLEGYYLKNYGTRTEQIPFSAIHGSGERYKRTVKPMRNVGGRWAVTIFEKNNDTVHAIGEFVQEPGGRLTGTFLVPSGDYRYLEGSVSGDSLFLSRFDGGSAILFSGKIDDDNSISHATLRSGLTNTTFWKARRDENAKLPDGYTHTKLKGGENKLNFRFPSTEGDTVSINDDRFKNKVVIVQILGSWCPNCMDETSFLSDYYNRNAQKGLEIVGLAYERTTDYNVSKKSLEPFRRRFKVNYPFLITGVSVSDTLRTEKTLLQIEKIEAFPTSIFIDRKGVVRKIHSGYDGPATGEHYEAFKKEFDELITSLLNES